MTERRFRVEALGEVGERVPLADAAARHASVLRLRAGDEVVLFDGRGGEALASLEDEAGELSGRLLERRQAREPWHVVLIVGMPKASALEELLRGATEAGASEVRLFGAARSVVRLDELRAPKKLERWRRILDEASRQSERAIVPTLSIHTSLAQAIAVLPEGARVAALDAREGRDLAEVLGAGALARVIVIGPEGGLDDEELGVLEARGGARARAPLPVLRVETAAVVATALAAMACSRVSR
ncbi:MAG: 16S rRNA (uracil(1498)-N(3))-methyltransferase [Sandaracinaceae bacterium]|jgi:16S rRNA (uracil1498-N3)-methyltransferase|nr:16S rRNA (uracil(1498)-N(3))-methyltransferase [Sandaracinaceae bacterium]